MSKTEKTPAGAVSSKRSPSLFYVTSEDWYFCLHRLPHALAAKQAGFDVTVICNVKNHRELIENAGLRLVAAPFNRRGMNPFKEFRTLMFLTSLYRREKPDVIQNIALKPIIYSNAAAYITNIKSIVNSIAGLGYIFISSEMKAKILRPIIQLFLRLIINRKECSTIFENPDDHETILKNHSTAHARTRVIPGCGVDTEHFAATPQPPLNQGKVVAVMHSRMLWDKGVGELVEAAHILKRRNSPIRIELYGDPDPDNPASIPIETLESWRHDSTMTWHPHYEDIPGLLAGCHIAVLPSYREGLPRSLLEAAACARPLVATDVPGCREIVEDGVNGLLTPPRNAEALADALDCLAHDPELRKRMGAASRKKVVGQLDTETVTKATVAVYQEALAQARKP